MGVSSLSKWCIGIVISFVTTYRQLVGEYINMYKEGYDDDGGSKQEAAALSLALDVQPAGLVLRVASHGDVGGGGKKEAAFL